jgi:hypothetical protein
MTFADFMPRQSEGVFGHPCPAKRRGGHTDTRFMPVRRSVPATAVTRSAPMEMRFVDAARLPALLRRRQKRRKIWKLHPLVCEILQNWKSHILHAQLNGRPGKCFEFYRMSVSSLFDTSLSLNSPYGNKLCNRSRDLKTASWWARGAGRCHASPKTSATVVEYRALDCRRPWEGCRVTDTSEIFMSLWPRSVIYVSCFPKLFSRPRGRQKKKASLMPLTLITDSTTPPLRFMSADRTTCLAHLGYTGVEYWPMLFLLTCTVATEHRIQAIVSTL